MKHAIDDDDLDQVLHLASLAVTVEHPYYETLIRVLGARSEACHRREHPESYLVVDAETGTMRSAEADPDDRPTSRWDAVRPAVTLIAALVSTEPGTVGTADALGAYVRDTFDALGVSVYDEDALYVALVVSGLMVEMAHNGLRTEDRPDGPTSPETVGAVAHIAQSLAAALIPYMPPEARL